LSDRGPGGGLIGYGTRVQRFSIDINPLTGHISRFRALETVKFTDPKGLLTTGISNATNGLNPLDLNGFEGTLGRPGPNNGRTGRNVRIIVFDNDRHSPSYAINDTEFLVLERDNRGIGVDDPIGARAVGSKRIYKINITGAST
jgi:hypothetical protein